MSQEHRTKQSRILFLSFQKLIVLTMRLKVCISHDEYFQTVIIEERITPWPKAKCANCRMGDSNGTLRGAPSEQCRDVYNESQG